MARGVDSRNFVTANLYLLTILEEEKLVQEYGEDYIRYQREVPRIIPFVRQL